MPKDICAKKFPTHHSLSPGMVMMSCQHKICYGFQILRSKESTICILNLLLTHFHTQPRIIIYDNACNLHRTCMIRYDIFLKNINSLEGDLFYFDYFVEIQELLDIDIPAFSLTDFTPVIIDVLPYIR